MKIKADGNLLNKNIQKQNKEEKEHSIIFMNTQYIPNNCRYNQYKQYFQQPTSAQQQLKIKKKIENDHYEIVVRTEKLWKLKKENIKIRCEKIDAKIFLFLSIFNQKKQIELPNDVKEKELKAKLNQNTIIITIPRINQTNKKEQNEEEEKEDFEFSLHKKILKNLGYSNDDLINLLLKNYNGNINQIVQDLKIKI